MNDDISTIDLFQQTFGLEDVPFDPFDSIIFRVLML